MASTVLPGTAFAAEAGAAADTVAIAASGAGIASAAEAEAEPEIVVTATGRSTATSANKTDTPIIELPQTISVISREEIDLRGSPTIADALSYTAGVQAEPAGIDSRTDEVTVRGFGAGGFSSNNNFVDGLRLPSGGQWTRTGFDPFGLQQIEVLKGPSSVLYGQTAPGGMVNLVTKRPRGDFHGEVLLQAAGSTDLENWNWQAGLDIGGALNADRSLRARFVGLARTGEAQVNGIENQRYYVSPSFTWAPGPDTSWTLLAQYQRDQGGATYQFLPALGTLYPTNGGHIENDANIGEPDWNQFDRNQLLLASFFQHRFGDSGLTFRNNMRYTHVDTLYRVVVLSGGTLTSCPPSLVGCIPGQTVQRRAVQGDGESDGIAIDNQMEARFTTGAIEHTLLGGIDYFHTDWEHYRDLVRGSLVLPMLDIFNPVPRGAAGFADALNPQVYTETESEQTGLYLQDQIAIGGLRLSVGGRQDWARDDAVNPINGRRTVTESSAFTWRAGAVYLFDNGLAPYFSYSESFQPVNEDRAANVTGEPFVPTTGQQFEAGLRFQRGRSIYVTIGAYQITQQNVITPAPEGATCELDDSGEDCSVQTGEVRVRGLEFEGRATLPWGMALIATATRQDGEITESNIATEAGNVRPQVPDWMASFFVDQRVRNGALRGLGFGGGIRYTGETFGDTANTFAIPDYTLFDLFARYDFGAANPRLEGLSFALNARNIADKRYVATCGSTASCYYGQGRSVTARLQFRW